MVEWMRTPCKGIKTCVTSRQFGKTTVSVGFGLAHCITNKRHFVRYSAPSQKDVIDIVVPVIEMFIELMPDDIKPKKRGYTWTFPNGSKFDLRGIAKRQLNRGVPTHLWIMDEAAFMQDIESYIEQKIVPMFTTTQGELIIISTPSESPNHPFTATYIAKAIQDGSLYVATWRENPLNTKEHMDTTVMNVYRKPAYPDGYSNPNFLREYECNWWIANSEHRVVEEYDGNEDNNWFQNYPGLPKLFRPWVGIDPGFTDHAAVVFGVWDWTVGTLIILDEWFSTESSTQKIVDAIREGEERLGFNMMPKELRTIRVCDTDARLIADLNVEYNLLVEGVMKAGMSKLGMIAKLRNAIEQKMIRVHPRCKNLRLQLELGTWDSFKKADYSRQVGMGHLDLLDALKYLSMTVDWSEFRSFDAPNLRTTKQGFEMSKITGPLQPKDPRLAVTATEQQLAQQFPKGRFVSFADAMRGRF